MGPETERSHFLLGRTVSLMRRVPTKATLKKRLIIKEISYCVFIYFQKSLGLLLLLCYKRSGNPVVFFYSKICRID